MWLGSFTKEYHIRIMDNDGGIQKSQKFLYIDEVMMVIFGYGTCGLGGTLAKKNFSYVVSLKRLPFVPQVFWSI